MTQAIICNTLERFDISKAAGIEGLPGIFIKDGAAILAKPIKELINLSINLAVVTDSCKVSKLKPLSKKGQN